MNKSDSYSKTYGIDINICMEFFIVFSRFEYCLKRAGYLYTYKNRCGADWYKFFTNNRDSINILLEDNVELFEYILKNPPKKQAIVDGQLSWKEVKEKDKITAINQYLRIIRNNLFHGGKFPRGPIKELARNKELLIKGKDILLKLKDIESKISNYFNPNT